MPEEEDEVLSRLEKKFPEMLPREEIISVLEEAQFHAKGTAFPFSQSIHWDTFYLVD